MATWRTAAAELLGTFVLVFVGTTGVAGAERTTAPILLAAAFAFGLGLLAALYAFGEVSGGHFNPAVSLAMFLDRRLSPRDLVRYWAAQFAGGILASLVLLVATSRAVVATTANRPVSNGTGFTIELVGTAIFVAIPFTGCSVNPARSLGPDLVGNTWHGLWLFFVAPGLGAVVAWVVHSTVVAGRLEPESPVAHVLDEPTSGA